MIDLYFWPTPNGYKITILLEELGWAYNVRPVHIGKGEQFAPIYDVLNHRLEAGPWLACDYSIADLTVFPWIQPHKWQGQTLDEFPGLRRWYDAVALRPAVRRGLAVLHDRLERNRAKPAGRAWEILFNQPAANP